MNRDGSLTATIVGVVLLGIAVFLVHQDDQNHRNACHHRGGHVVRLYRSSVCLSRDDKLLNSWW